MYPNSEGDTVCAIFLETLVSPEAAVLSSSLTMATMYDCLVGTSICDIVILIKYSIAAICKEGANATKMSKILDGRCVNTIVFTRPILSAIFAAAIYDKPVKTLADEKI